MDWQNEAVTADDESPGSTDDHAEAHHGPHDEAGHRIIRASIYGYKQDKQAHKDQRQAALWPPTRSMVMLIWLSSDNGLNPTTTLWVGTMCATPQMIKVAAPI